MTEPVFGLTRRRLLEAAGLSTLGGFLAACGASSSGGEPGRVGNAPALTTPATFDMSDAVVLRTMTSIEYLHVDLYQTVTEAGALDDRAQGLIGRFVEDHQAAADELRALTEEAGGEPYGCTNDWYERRIVPPILAAVNGDPADDVAPSDEPANDLLRISYGFESMTAAAYQRMMELLAEPALRPPLARIGAIAARHSAAVAMHLTGVPDGYVSPVVLGGELTPDESGRALLFAIPTRFGSLTATEIVVGVPNDAGTRPSFALETPADNAYVYEDFTCDA